MLLFDEVVTSNFAFCCCCCKQLWLWFRKLQLGSPVLWYWTLSPARETIFLCFFPVRLLFICELADFFFSGKLLLACCSIVLGIAYTQYTDCLHICMQFWLWFQNVRLGSSFHWYRSFYINVLLYHSAIVLKKQNPALYFRMNACLS